MSTDIDYNPSEAETSSQFPRFFAKTGHKIGIGWLLFSLAVYCWYSLADHDYSMRDFISYLAVIQYTVSMIYGLWALFTKRDLYAKAIALSILYVTCFAFNSEIHLFGAFDWLQTTFMIGTQACLIGLHFLPRLSFVGQRLMLFMAGLSVSYTFHLIVHLVPSIPMATVGIILLGFGIMAYIPVFSFFHFIRMVRTYPLEFSVHKTWFWGGVLLPLLAVVGYLIPYAQFHSQVSDLVGQYEASDKKLTRALYIRQNADIDYLHEEYLKMEPVTRRGELGTVSNHATHQPLEEYAGFLVGSLGITDVEKDVIFSSLYEHRHANSPRFWNGEDLQTDHIATTIDVFPEHRIAYVEKVIDVVHNQPGTWRLQQEAVYTFHLPEGAIGTSLSLWINGVEEPARLSTTQKANAAYSGIVGRERRDPAIMNWLDGNRLSVNVFPVQPDLPRKFKVGFTIPIRMIEERMLLENVYLQGPDMSDGTESVRVTVHHAIALPELVLEGGIEQTENGFAHDGKLLEPWFMSWKASPLSPEAFCFNGNCYRTESLAMQQKTFAPSKVLLDINELWTDDLLDDVTSILEGKSVYVYNHRSELIALTPENAKTLFSKLQGKAFSIVPPDIFNDNGMDAADFLVLTKGARDFPLLSDLPYFSEEREDSVRQLWLDQPPFFLFELSKRATLNTQILKDAGLAYAQHGTVADLKKLLAEQRFPTTTTDTGRVAVMQNETSIVRVSTDGLASAEGAFDTPDHLMRLFNYGLLMEGLKQHYFKRSAVGEDQIALARSAYVVSPFSSLVSLESVADYERFDITNPEPSKSLFNAGSLTGGSVPEPHEWALILIAALSMSFLLYKRFF